MLTAGLRTFGALLCPNWGLQGGSGVTFNGVAQRINMSGLHVHDVSGNGTASSTLAFGNCNSKVHTALPCTRAACATLPWPARGRHAPHCPALHAGGMRFSVSMLIGC